MYRLIAATSSTVNAPRATEDAKSKAKARPISIWKPITELPRKNPFFNQNQLDGIDTEV